MISLGTRFADYGLTGGFFLVVGTALLAWLFPADVNSALSMLRFTIDATASNAPPVVESFIISISIASLIIILFFVGLLLDLLGSILILREVFIFREQLDLGESWIRSVLKPYEKLIGDDLDYLFEEFASPVQVKVANRRMRVFWKLENWKAFWSVFKRGTLRRGVMKAFSRLESVMLSHLMLNSEPARLTMLFEQHRLCRVARAISGGLIMLAALIIGTGILSFFALLDVINFGISPMSSLARATQAIAFVGVLMLLSLFVTIRSYSRYCGSLFSLVFVLSRTTRHIRGSELSVRPRSGRTGGRKAKQATASSPTVALP